MLASAAMDVSARAAATRLWSRAFVRSGLGLLLVVSGGCGPESKSDTKSDVKTDAESAQVPSAEDDQPSAPDADCTTVTDCTAGCQPCVAGTCEASAQVACDSLAKLHGQGQPPQFDLESSARFYRLACERGHIDSCTPAGNMLQDGRGVARDIEAAKALYGKACDGGFGVGCMNLGFVHRGVLGVESDLEQAQAMFDKAAAVLQVQCETGDNPLWCINYGTLYQMGLGVDKDDDRAAAIYKSGCDRGSDESCVNRILLELQGERVEPSTVPDRVQELQRLCDKNNPLACSVLGSLLQRGPATVARDPSGATRALTAACELGEKDACVDLAVATTDDAASMELLRRSCDLGHGRSCAAVATAALSKEPGTKPADIAEFLRRACHTGLAESCGQLGTVLISGVGIAKDEDAGWRLLEAACRQRESRSCADLIRAGRKLPLPAEQAKIFREQACAGGVKEACEP